MKITFVGTANAMPRPERRQTCLYVEAGGSGHVVDCGDGAATRLLLDPAVDWSALRALLITHFHPDHAAGLFVLLHLLHMQAKDNPGWPLSNGEYFHLCLPECAAARRIVGCLSAFHIPPEKLCFPLHIEYYEPGRLFRAGELNVTPWPSSHSEEAHGFTIEADGTRVVFSGDLGEPEEITEPAHGADLVITECAHFHPAELVAALQDAGAKRYLVTHLHDDLVERLEEAQPFFESLAAAGEFGFAHDGLVVSLD